MCFMFVLILASSSYGVGVRGVESGGGRRGAAPPQYEKWGRRKYVFAPPIIVHIYNTSILNGWLYLK